MLVVGFVSSCSWAVIAEIVREQAEVKPAGQLEPLAWDNSGKRLVRHRQGWSRAEAAAFWLLVGVPSCVGRLEDGREGSGAVPLATPCRFGARLATCPFVKTSLSRLPWASGAKLLEWRLGPVANKRGPVHTLLRPWPSQRSA